MWEFNFKWDARKTAAKASKPPIVVDEAETVFLEPDAIHISDKESGHQKTTPQLGEKIMEPEYDFSNAIRNPYLRKENAQS